MSARLLFFGGLLMQNVLTQAAGFDKTGRSGLDSSRFFLYFLKWMPNGTAIAYIGLGSNLGDRAGNLLLAIRGLLEASFEITKLSAVYETEPVEIDSAEKFLNMVAEVRVESINPTQMMARMLRIEYLLGRRHKSLKRPRTIDLDLLFYGRERLQTEFLTLPHPRLHLRNFVLVPLVEVAPALVHPVLKKNIQTLLAESRDTSRVERWSAAPNHRRNFEPAG